MGSLSIDSEEEKMQVAGLRGKGQRTGRKVSE